ncbi:branched-chain-amino-acid aminotransferase [Mycobacterium antarcticum]|uniref:branched-chain amino acid aminotransferase n=1 Tax=unclassified Mycolicibacterium TaxID=2636767 RepID=UPI0023A402A5|nr:MULTISPECIES: branched-chain amino acid aminotransferase [unclassified Mycolicibacterium]BDX34372.1 branched-chain-amino-acid aminotransferase [Mycolicibacterium sp. TUM20985]GLP77581.1 branched-chain-amino-acid aminotransferase [Mycolicibacterium sp. TUM20983]GLP82020.1 branched-chain-amino-acid aminotransferase [Mycolicibacterium sp. TUM20984]
MNDVAALEFTRRDEVLATPGFGDVFTDHMVTMRWSTEVGWREAQVGPLTGMSLHPATMALHYGQTIFEGMKAFWRPNGQRALFRAEDHARRFNNSARRMAMPTLPEADFVAALEALLRVDGDWVPRARGHSLYLRPFMIAAETGLGLRPAEEYLFAVIGTPVRPASVDPKAMRLWATPEYVRAAPGGTGAAKCGGNYGGSFIVQREAAANHCDDVVWLDARQRRYVEEAGGSNLFFVESTPDGPRLRTPPLSGTLLAGVTRNSILRLAESLGYPVSEEPLTLDWWEHSCRTGRITETFACGTARSIVPVGHVVSADRDWPVGDGTAGPVTSRLREALLDIHYGEAPDEFGWMRLVDTDE